MSLKVNGVELIKSASESFNLPVGTSLQRPASPVIGMIRYNTENKQVEVYSGDKWNTIISIHVSTPSSIGTGTNVIYGWGSNMYGEALLSVAANGYTVPTLSDETFNFKKIVTSMGGDTTFVIAANGTLWGVGKNTYGQLGLGDTADRTLLTQIGTSTWSDISCYGDHVAGIKTDGTLWTWGKNDVGQLAQGDLVNYSVPNQVGTLAVWSTVACGESHTVAIKTDGKLWASGKNTNGQLGTGNTTNATIMTPVSTTVTTAWGRVYCGQNSSYAINISGYMYSWGDNTLGQLGVNSTTSSFNTPTKITALADLNVGNVSIGPTHCLAITPTNALYAWGNNASGQLSTGNTVNRTSPTRYGTGTNWWQCAAGDGYSLALTSDGTMYGCGLNNKYQLGLDDTINRSVFEQTSSIYWGAIFAGKDNTIASKSVASTADYGGITFDNTGTAAVVTVWAVPTGVNSICIAGIGGGGSGGRNSGGGGGGAAFANNIPVSLGQKLRITVGAGGFGRSTLTYGTGIPGGSTTIELETSPGVYTTIMTCTGGSGGPDASASATAGGGTGGSYSFAPTYFNGTYGGLSGGGGGYFYSSSNFSYANDGASLGFVGGGGGGGGRYYTASYDTSFGGNSIGNGGYFNAVAVSSGGGGGGGGGGVGQGVAGSTGSITTTRYGAAGGIAGGGGGGGYYDGGAANTSGKGGNGIARIIWGAGRSFPSFQTGKLGSEV